jgi:hypothetical protein
MPNHACHEKKIICHTPTRAWALEKMNARKCKKEVYQIYIVAAVSHAARDVMLSMLG